MDRENKIVLAKRVMVISGIFCGIVALLLILNFWHMKQHEPLESQAIEALVKRLSQEPNNEELKEEIRSFDLLARKAYFTSQWQIKTGTWLLLLGGIILAVSMKVYTDQRAGILPPEELTEGLLKARANAQYWLFLAGGLSALTIQDRFKFVASVTLGGNPAQPGDLLLRPQLLDPAKPPARQRDGPVAR